jgi:hypothetical protein
MGARQIEHQKNQNTDIARRSSRAKPDGASPIHPGFANRTNTTFGAPPSGNPPDASSPLPTDPSRRGKSFPVPQIAHGCRPDPERARFDPGLAEVVMAAATRAPDDYAQDLHATLPRDVNEN